MRTAGFAVAGSVNSDSPTFVLDIEVSPDDGGNDAVKLTANGWGPTHVPEYPFNVVKNYPLISFFSEAHRYSLILATALSW